MVYDGSHTRKQPLVVCFATPKEARGKFAAPKIESAWLNNGPNACAFAGLDNHPIEMFLFALGNTLRQSTEGDSDGF